MSDETKRYELRRIGKRHAYEVYVDGRFVAHIHRALIGHWVVGTAHNEVSGTFPSKESAACAAVKARS